MRLFDEHSVRSTQSLDGAWRFVTDPDDRGEALGYGAELPASAETVIVPSVWNTKMGLLEYEGAAWYSRSFFFEGGTLRLAFEGVMTEARVYLDGEEIGSHYGGFTPFAIIATEVSEGTHTLTLRVDNRFDEHSIPQAMVDWYHYGGITRSVRAEQLCGLSVLGARVEYRLSQDLTSVALRFAYDLYNASGEKIADLVRASIGGQVLLTPAALDAGEHKTLRSDELILSDIALWSPETPTLYPFTITTTTDDLTDRTGFREVKVEGGQILLNRKSIELRGVNRHEEHPDFGFAFPASLMARDLDIAAEMGCNTLRGSHYPNAPAFVDLLDERGMLFWSEIPIWGVGFKAETLGDSLVLERGAEMHREMVEYYYNHPSIIIWGMHNEIKSDTQEGYEMSRRYYSYLKENGGGRIVTYASDHPMTDICLQFCDVISINSYFGWYTGTIEYWAQFLEKFRARRDELGFADKPVIMSEFGAAAVYGHQSFDDRRWSENYQARLVTHCLELFHRDPMIVGSYIWQMCDIRTSREMGLNRARGYNNKGLLNEYRNPKAAYFAAQACYRRFDAESSN